MFSQFDIDELFEQFPPVEFAVAYGSGVLKQNSYDYEVESKQLPMIDMIFAVSDPLEWHRANLSKNPSHYGFDIPLSAGTVAHIQEKFGAALWYNTYVPLNIKAFPDRPMKYGIISTASLVNDLRNWNWLYSSGRLHKPVFVMKSNEEILAAININHFHAVNVALSMMPPTFSEKQLYKCIAQLSYTGDPRMHFAENPNKVDNLVSPQMKEYRRVYKDVLGLFMDRGAGDSPKGNKLLDELPANVLEDIRGHVRQIDQVGVGEGHEEKSKDDGDINFEQNVVMNGSTAAPTADTFAIQSSRYAQFPLHLRHRLGFSVGTNTTVRGEIKHLTSSLSHIVSRAATAQSVKGLFTAGLISSARYVFQKILKRFK